MIGTRAICDVGKTSYSSFDETTPRHNGFKIDFDIHMSASKSLNKSHVSITNVRQEDAVSFKVNRKKLQIQLFAADAPSSPILLGRGDPIKDGITHGSDVDRILKITFLDGLRARTTSRVAVSFKGKVKVSEVIREAAKRLGIPIWAIRIDEDIELKNGFSEAGDGFDVLARLARMTRCEFSIQNGKLVFLGQNQIIKKIGRFYSFKNRSLYAVPEQRDKGRMLFELKLSPNLFPGVAFGAEAEGSAGTGFFKAITVSHRGSSWSGSKTIVEAKRLNTKTNNFVKIA